MTQPSAGDTLALVEVQTFQVLDMPQRLEALIGQKLTANKSRDGVLLEFMEHTLPNGTVDFAGWFDGPPAMPRDGELIVVGRVAKVVALTIGAVPIHLQFQIVRRAIGQPTT